MKKLRIARPVEERVDLHWELGVVLVDALAVVAVAALELVEAARSTRTQLWVLQKCCKNVATSY